MGEQRTRGSTFLSSTKFNIRANSFIQDESFDLVLMAAFLFVLTYCNAKPTDSLAEVKKKSTAWGAFECDQHCWWNDYAHRNRRANEDCPSCLRCDYYYWFGTCYCYGPPRCE